MFFISVMYAPLADVKQKQFLIFITPRALWAQKCDTIKLLLEVIKIMKKILILMLAIGILICALWAPLTEQHYKIDFHTDAFAPPLYIALISDFHSGHFYQDVLFEKLHSAQQNNKLDIIVLTGDIIDSKAPIDGAIKLFKNLEDMFPLVPKFFVTGNHEFWSNAYDNKKLVRTYGIVVLDLQLPSVSLHIKGRRIWLFGIDDPAGLGNTWKQALKQTIRDDSWQNIKNADIPSWLPTISAPPTLQSIKILLSHRPEYVEEFAKLPIDIILAGHTHGGQVRIPFLNNGIYAPNQGIFPPFAGGMYHLTSDSILHDTSITDDDSIHNIIEHTQPYLIVSRGMSLNWKLPRIFNPPELVWVEID